METDNESWRRLLRSYAVLLALDILLGLFLLATIVMVVRQPSLPYVWVVPATLLSALVWALTRNEMITEYLQVGFVLWLAWILVESALVPLIAHALDWAVGWVAGGEGNAARLVLHERRVEQAWALLPILVGLASAIKGTWFNIHFLKAMTGEEST